MTAPNDIISLIQDLDTNTGFDVFIPSLQQEVKFKQLTTEQLKRLLKTIIDSPVYNTEFIVTFNSIIKENCLIKEVNTDNFTVYDKVLILFKTRIESISKEYTFSFTKTEIEENKLSEQNKTVDLQTHFSEFLKKQINFESTTYDFNGCVLTCNLPTVSTENKLEKELHKNVKLDINTPEELRNVVGETFINEITKYITAITINESTIDLLSLNFKERIKIVEKLPTQAINNVVKYIENYRDSIKPLLSITIEVETENRSKTVLEKELPQDASFFNM